jgi:hypothetical protein
MRRSRLVVLVFLVILALTAPVSNADMFCHDGYTYWMDHLPYCVMSSMSHECLACDVTGDTDHGGVENPM